jgi:uncharacterized protein with PQ loop repeat
MLMVMAHPAHPLANHIHHTRKKKGSTGTIDTMAYIVGIGGNVATLPQIVRVWQGAAPGVAVSTWAMFVGIGVIWLVYAVKHNQKPLIVAQLAGLSCNFAIVVGWLIHN